MDKEISGKIIGMCKLSDLKILDDGMGRDRLIGNVTCYTRRHGCRSLEVHQ